MATRKSSAAKKTPPAIKAPVKNTAAKKTVAKKALAPAKLAAKPAVKEAIKKVKKEYKDKVLRDSFTMPQSEYQKIAEIKAVCLKSGLHVKKSEVLRAGLKALTVLDEAHLKRALSGLDKIKTGRPKKH